MRTVKEDQYRAKCDEIVATALKLSLSKGFQAMSVQDLLDELHMSKGAFFHYFASKADLLRRMVARVLAEGMRRLLPIVQEEGVPAIVRLNRFFATIADWKTGRKSFFLTVVRVWYEDDNAVVRQRVRDETVEQMGPLIDGIIRQGAEEGTFTPASVDQLGKIVLSIFENMVDTLSKSFLLPGQAKGRIESMSACVRAHTAAVERTIGAPPDSVRTLDVKVLERWIAESDEARDTGGGGQ